MDKFGAFVVPTIIFIIIILGFLKNVPVFDTFVKGATDGMKSTAAIAPSLIGLIVSVNMLKASGALDMFTEFISPVANYFHIPPIVLPLAFLRPISGSGSIAFLDTIFSVAGVDSFAGRVASVMMGSTETTFYAIAIYFGAVGIKNTRHTIPAALIGDFVGFIVSIITVSLLFH